MKKSAPSVKNTSLLEKAEMLAWLGTKSNFDLITGKAATGQPVVAGARLKKSDAYRSLTAYVNDNCCSNWTEENTKSRFNTYITKYKEAKRQAGRTGWGVTDDDKSRGLTTVESKLEAMATHYFELDKLFGHRENVNPTLINESSVFEEEEPLHKETSFFEYGSQNEYDFTGGLLDEYDFTGEYSMESFIASSAFLNSMPEQITPVRHPSVQQIKACPTIITPLANVTNRLTENPKVVAENKRKFKDDSKANNTVGRKLDFGTIYMNAETANRARLKEQFDAELIYKKQCREEDLREKEKSEKAKQKQELLLALIQQRIPMAECLANLKEAGYD